MLTETDDRPKTLNIGLSPTAPPPIPDGYKLIQVEVQSNQRGGGSHKAKVDRSYRPYSGTPEDSAIANAFEHVLLEIGLEMSDVALVCENADRDELRIVYRGKTDEWTIERDE